MSGMIGTQLEHPAVALFVEQLQHVFCLRVRLCVHLSVHFETLACIPASNYMLTNTAVSSSCCVK